MGDPIGLELDLLGGLLDKTGAISDYVHLIWGLLYDGDTSPLRGALDPTMLNTRNWLPVISQEPLCDQVGWAGHYLHTAMSSFLFFSGQHLSECLPSLPCAYSGSLTPCVPVFRFPCPPYFHISLCEISRGNSLSVVSKHFFHFLTWTLNSTFLLKIPSTSLPVTLILRTCISSFHIL